MACIRLQALQFYTKSKTMNPQKKITDITGVTVVTVINKNVLCYVGAHIRAFTFLLTKTLSRSRSVVWQAHVQAFTLKLPQDHGRLSGVFCVCMWRVWCEGCVWCVGCVCTCGVVCGVGGVCVLFCCGGACVCGVW